MKFTALACAAAMLTIGVAPAEAVTNLLSNGSFESGFTGWTQTSSGSTTSNTAILTYGSTNPGAYGEAVSADNANSSSPDATGSKAVYFSTDTGTQTLSQTISLQAGHTYSFGFDYYLPANGYSNSNDFQLAIAFGGNPVTSISSAGTSAQRWYGYSMSQTLGTDMTGALSFSFTGNGVYAKDVAVDRVYVIDTTAAVPEPATWAMMICGFGFVGAAMRLRTRRTSPAR